MRLHTNPASPFGRKVVVVAHEKGLLSAIEIAARQLTPVTPNEAVVADNPIGKIPCLVTDEGMALFDSRVIAEYLDSIGHGPKLFPPAGQERFSTLRLHALGDGILDAAVLTRYETFVRPEALRWDDWVAGQKLKITRALDHLEAEPKEPRGAPRHRHDHDRLRPGLSRFPHAGRALAEHAAGAGRLVRALRRAALDAGDRARLSRLRARGGPSHGRDRGPAPAPGPGRRPGPHSGPRGHPVPA